jgi:hypothetical protein
VRLHEQNRQVGHRVDPPAEGQGLQR